MVIMDKATDKRLSRIVWRYAATGFAITALLTVILEYVLDYISVGTIAGATFGVMGLMMSYAVRAAYRVGLESTFQPVETNGGQKAV